MRGSCIGLEKSETCSRQLELLNYSLKGKYKLGILSHKDVMVTGIEKRVK